MATGAVVLVVDDEPLIRALTVDALEDDGFSVLEAATGDYALTVLRTRQDISAVVTDVEMPGQIDGFALASMAAGDAARSRHRHHLGARAAGVRPCRAGRALPGKAVQADAPGEHGQGASCGNTLEWGTAKPRGLPRGRPFREGAQ